MFKCNCIICNKCIVVCFDHLSTTFWLHSSRNSSWTQRVIAKWLTVIDERNILLIAIHVWKYKNIKNKLIKEDLYNNTKNGQNCQNLPLCIQHGTSNKIRDDSPMKKIQKCQNFVKIIMLMKMRRKNLQTVIHTVFIKHHQLTQFVWQIKIVSTLATQ